MTVSARRPGHVKPLLGHVTGVALPMGLQKPGATERQSRTEDIPDALDHVPPGQACGVEEPSIQYEPRGHTSHEVAPRCAWYVPLAHWLQMPVPTVAAKEPARQSRHASGSALPGMGFALPMAHRTHDALLNAPTDGLNVPAAHGSNVCRRLAAPSEAQKPPTGHALHELAPATSESVPAAQAVHPALPLIALKLPGEHRMQFPRLRPRKLSR